MPELLTKRKTAWKNQFKPDVIRGEPLNPNAAVEARYYTALADLIRKMTDDTEKQVLGLFEEPHAQEYFAEDASVASQARILTNALIRKFDALVATKAQPLAVAFANQSNRSSSSALHASIQKLSGGLSLPTAALVGRPTEILTATIAENVSLIKTIPQQYLKGVQQAVLRSITTGNGMQDLVPYLARSKRVTLRRARFIARDQTKKAFENLNTGRMRDLGLKEFEWLHTGGSNHPRKTHIAMSGKIFKLDEGAYDKDADMNVWPGQLPGCRCRKLPIITFGNKP